MQTSNITSISKAFVFLSILNCSDAVLDTVVLVLRLLEGKQKVLIKVVKKRS